MSSIKSIKCIFCDKFIVNLAASVTPCVKHFYCVLCLEKWRTQNKDLTNHSIVLDDELSRGVHLKNCHNCPECLQPGKVKYTAVCLLPKELLEEVEESPKPVSTATKRCLTCEICNMTFNSTAAKSKHRWKHLPRTKCPDCPITLTYKSDLARHKSRCPNRPRISFLRHKK